MEYTDQLTGIVERIIFHNEENGFTVFIINSPKTKETTVKGHTPTLHTGQQVTVSGSWITHPKFGKQFEAQQCTIALPTSAVGIQKYLASGMIKGIGPAYAERLVKTFGAQALEVIDTQPYRLHEVEGIGPKRVERIIEAWKDQKEISHIMVFLQEKNISPVYATKIYKKYHNQAIKIVQENPYRLADDIWGIGFKVADQIAQNMGFALDSLKRISSGILYTLTTIINNGALYGELESIKIKAIELLALPETDDITQKVKLAFHDLYNNDRIKLITHQEINYLTLTSHYFTENGVAQKIKTILEQKSRRSFDIDTIYTTLRTTSSTIVLNDDQQRAIITALQHKITVITGGPGTGKTTVIKQLLSVLDSAKVSYKLAAPTGRAAKRITESTQRSAVTLHRLLEFDPTSMSFKHNEQNALNLDFLIIDESSMIDIFLAYALLKVIPYHAQLVFIGDINQLPSVGPGNFLRDIIESTIIPTVRLTQIFRQAQTSMIILNAHRINNGEFPSSSFANADKDFFFIKEEEPQAVPALLEKIYRQTLPKYGISARQSIVLVPMNRGSVGTIALNDLLQQIINPTQDLASIQHHGTRFTIGDRVMQIKNNYDKFIFNGDMGIIRHIDMIDRTIEVHFIDQQVSYDFSELDELVLAYATSIHKSQGSEFDAVIVPIFMQHFTLLARNLIYTAITRAKKLCIFIGQSRAIAMGIKNNKEKARTTFLTHYLTSDLQCR